MIILRTDGAAAIDAILAVLQHSGRLSAKSSKLWEKLIVAWWKFDGLPFEDNRRTPCRMLKMAVQQGRSERRGEGVRLGTLSF